MNNGLDIQVTMSYAMIMLTEERHARTLSEQRVFELEEEVARYKAGFANLGIELPEEGVE